jgi:hypothetical protein
VREPSLAMSECVFKLEALDRRYMDHNCAHLRILGKEGKEKKG